MMKPQVPFSSVRVATPDDEDSIMNLCRMLHEENGLFPLNEEMVRDLIRSVILGKQGFIGVIGSTGKLEASILLKISTMYYSDVPFLEEYWNFVHPDYRRAAPDGRGRANYLINFAKSCADQMGMPLLIGIVSNVRTEAKTRLYDRVLPRAGAFYLYRGDHGEMRA